jgi:hypothetical protein
MNLPARDPGAAPPAAAEQPLTSSAAGRPASVVDRPLRAAVRRECGARSGEVRPVDQLGVTLRVDQQLLDGLTLDPDSVILAA